MRDHARHALRPHFHIADRQALPDLDEPALGIETGGRGLHQEVDVVSLTPTEFKVLYALASFPQKVFTREELVQKALGYEFEGYERSIDAHIKNIRHKIEDDPRNPSLIPTVYGIGYRFSGKRDA